MLQIAHLDLEQLAMALADQDGMFEHVWMIDPETGEITFMTADIDGHEDFDDLGLVRIEPLPSRVWYRDMADFAAGVTDDQASRTLSRAIQGRGAFRRFKDELLSEFAYLSSAWHTFTDTRARCRAVEWLADKSLVDSEAAGRYLAEYADPDIP